MCRRGGAASENGRVRGFPLTDLARASDTTRRTEWFFAHPNVAVWGLALLHGLAARLPIERVSAIGGRIGRTLGPRTRRHRRALDNIAQALPSLGAEERERVARGMWDNFGRTVAESFVIDRIAADTSRVSLQNEDEVRRTLQRKGGAVFVGLHFGNWEATVIPAARVGENPVGVYKPLRNEKADAYLRGLRRELYPGGLLPGNAATLLKLARHVRDGGSMCMLADHRDNSGRIVPFFGKPAPSAALPAMLGVKYKLPIYAVRVDRANSARFSVHIEPVAVASTGDSATDVEATTAAIQAVFEKWITARPDQWVWFYNRWQRGQPDAAATVAGVGRGTAG